MNPGLIFFFDILLDFTISMSRNTESQREKCLSHSGPGIGSGVYAAQCRHQKGFALIITLSLMVLLTVIAVGLLTLSSISLRSTQSGNYECQARANARLGLLLAIGELQKEVGPDQRITARADILDTDTSSPAPDGVPQSNWLGVWNSWTDWLNSPAIKATYDKGRTSQFRRWLVSYPDPTKVSDLSLARSTSLPESALMVSASPAGTSGLPTGAVTAPMVQTNGNGRFAWWIAGENQKAHVAATSPKLANDAQRLHDRSNWPRGRAEWLLGLESASSDTSVLDRSLTLPSYGLGGINAKFPSELRARFHDLTVESYGLSSNTRLGGLKKDLNLLLEMDTLPSQFGTFASSTPNGTIVPIRSYTGELPSTFYAQNKDFSSWYKLRQYYQLYRGGGEETAADCVSLAFKAGLWGTAQQPNINYNWHDANLDYYGIGRTPIVTRLMLVFSTRRVASASLPGTYDYKLGVNPVVVLWNPYNVTLNSPRLWIQITPGALEYKAYVDNTIKVDWTTLRRSNTPTGQVSPFELNIYPMEGKGPTFEKVPIILKPGETRIYSAVSGFLQAQDNRFAELYPGYLAPDAGGGFEVDLNGLTGLSANAKVELAMRLSDKRTDHGGQYQIYWTVRNGQTADRQRYNEMAANPVEDGKPIYLAEDSPGKRVLFSTSPQRVPFANFQFVQKSGQDLRNPGADYAAQDSRCRNFVHANPVNQRAMYGEATTRMRGLSQYQVQIETGSGNALNPDFDPANNRAYTGSAISPGASVWPGQPSVVTNEFPLVPVTSIASLMHFKLNRGDTRNFNTYRHLWNISANQAIGIGNSFAHPLIAGDAIYQDVADASCRGSALQMQLIRDFHDHAFLNNDALWDDWFCSGITREDQGLFQTGRGMTEVVQKFWSGEAPTQNPHLIPWRPSSDPVAKLEDRLLSGALPAPIGYQIAARYFMIKGAFNINSTSVDAWKAFLAGSQDKTIVSIDPQTGNVRSDAAPSDRVTFSRFSLPASPKEGVNAGDPAAWLGVRHLTPQQTDRLARECVRQVKERGPFLNLSDFINRRLAIDETGVRGALQAAIDWDETLGRSPEPSNSESINGRFKGGDDFISAAKISSWGLNFPAAATGSRFAGIPGYLTQADVLKRVGNMITPRDDTFRIRSYGEARDTRGVVLAKCWCEAVVQRLPDYVDTADMPEIATLNLTSNLNKTFGRRFSIVSFRWLGTNEI